MIWLLACLGASTFALAAALGIWLAARFTLTLTRLDGAPPERDIHPAWLMIGASFVGAMLGVSHEQLVLILYLSVLTVPFIAALQTDLRFGLVPDLITLPALGLVTVYALITHNPNMFMGAILALPFALAAIQSRGLGMGWGDVKLIALIGATMGIERTLSVLFMALITLVFLQRIDHRQPKEPVAFVPYLVGACGVTCMLLP